MADSPQQIAEAIFLEAVEMPADERNALVASKCGDDQDLQAMVDALLMADAAAGDDDFLADRFLDSPNLGDESSMSAAPAADITAASDAERFEILTVHDRGGLGEVLLARDRQLGRDVAIKQILGKWQGHQEANARFLQEAEVTGRLEHPGIVPVYALGTWPDGRPFYAMRFIEGKTLKEVIRDHRTKRANEMESGTKKSNSNESETTETQSILLRGLLNRFVDVCNTIEYAHSRRIIHRDIKPSNIMVGPYGETLVVDWGLAKMLESNFDDSLTAQFIEHLDEDRVKSESSRTRIGGAVGTPQYMSPEQASGKIDSVGIRTDVYLLGATLYQILTGIPPHDEASVAKLITRIKDGILIRPREIDSGIPAPLEAICLKAMSTESSDRYSSASELAHDIERWLADEPVSAFTDRIPARVGRWIRKHRTLAMSGGVAAALLTFGLVTGSMLWSYQQSRNFKLEKERTAKENQLLASQAERLAETRESAESAWQMSSREIDADRLDSAVAILRRASKELTATDSMTSPTSRSILDAQQERISERLTRLEKLTEFYRQSELCQQYNVMSRDTQGIMASTAALKSLGVWDKTDWWMHLPEQDLNPNRRDRLRWDVYQQWLMLDGMLVKTIGTRLFGVMQKGSGGRLLRALRRMQSGAGIEEANAAIVVSDRIDYFRQAETARWYRGIARYRTRTGRRTKAEELHTPRNAADAQKMGVLCLISAMDPSFRVVFRDYKNQDPILAGRDLFQRSASLRPDHYWTQLGLGQMQYFLAKRESKPTWLSYQPAVQTMGRCIAINPKSCFAYADRSSLFRFQHEAIKREQKSLGDQEEDQDDTEQQEQLKELLLWSIQDAQTAYQLADDQPWVGWTYGMALAAAGQNDQAVNRFLHASIQTFPLLESGDSTLIAADDIRGRQEAAEYAAEKFEERPDQLRLQTLLASICLNQQKHEAAMEHIEASLSDSDSSAHAHAVRGMLRLNQENFVGANEDFLKASEKDPEHIWAAYGLAVCQEYQGNDLKALDLFQRATELATDDEHRAACLLGTGRVQAMLQRYDLALAAFKSAQDSQAACNIAKAAKPLVIQFREWRSESTHAEESKALESFLKSLAQLPRATKVEIAGTSDSKPMRAALLNGGFELGRLRYWSNESGIHWLNTAGYEATAKITKKHAYQDRHSLHIVGSPSEAGAKSDDSIGGSTAQTFPIPAQSQCRVSAWVKTNALKPKSARIEVHIPGRPLVALKVPSGQHDWIKIEAKFEVGRATDPSLTVVPVELKIVSSGPGEVWYDDIQVTFNEISVGL